MKKIFAALIAFGTSIAFGATTVPVQLINPAGSTSGQAIVSTGASSAPGWGNPTATLGAQAANTVVANFTGSPANPAAFSVPSCSTSTSALQYTSGTGFTCYANSASLMGSTFTGAVSLSYSNPTFTLNDTSGTSESDFGFASIGFLVWNMFGQSSGAKTWGLSRYNAGSFVDVPLSISNSTGSVTMPDGITGSPISGSTGSFTTLAASSTVSGTGFSNYLASPPAIGSTTPAAVTGSVVNTTSNFQGPAAGYSISTVTGVGSGGAIQLFDATHGNQVNVQNAGATVASFSAGGITVGTGYPLIPASVAGIKGTTTNDTPNAGSIGENPTGSTSGTSMTNNTPANCTSVSLTAGNWLVWGVASFAPNTGTTVAQIVSGISTTSATLGATGTFTSLAATLTTAAAQSQATPAVTLKLAATTTVYLVGQSQFATSTMTCSGNISALRIR